MNRRKDLDRFYGILDELRESTGGPRLLKDCHGRMDWPQRGVYFFFEQGEFREDGKTPRVVRVGTHALRPGSKTTLWHRLATHRGRTNGTGNHRASIFRKHVGTAILNRTKRADDYKEWDRGSSAPRRIRQKDRPIEIEVSRYIGQMPFLWLKVDDTPGPCSMRASLESNSIALLSNYQRPEPIDRASERWLGRCCASREVRDSGLWNVNHVSGDLDSCFLGELRELVRPL